MNGYRESYPEVEYIGEARVDVKVTSGNTPVCLPAKIEYDGEFLITISKMSDGIVIDVWNAKSEEFDAPLESISVNNEQLNTTTTTTDEESDDE